MSRITSTNPLDILCNQMNQLNFDLCQTKKFICSIEGRVKILEELEDLTLTAIITEEQTSGTHSSTTTSATSGWSKRVLNNIVSDSGIGVTIENNQFTLPAGTYSFNISSPGYNCDVHKLRLDNITSSTTVAYGTSEYSLNSNNIQTRSVLQFTEQITVASTYEVYHYFTTRNSVSNYGFPSSIPTIPEVYLQIQIQRIGA